MKIVPNLSQAYGVVAPLREPSTTVRALDPVPRQPERYPQSAEAGERLAEVLKARQSAATGQPRPGIESHRMHRAMDAYQAQGRVDEREYLSSVLGIDVYA